MEDQAHRRYVIWKVCGSKIQYLSEETAKKHAPSSQTAYQCPFCKLWHTGHKKEAK